MIKASLVAFALVTFVAGGASAAGDKTYTLSKDKTQTSVSQGSMHYTSPQPPRGGNVLFSNIGTKYPKGLYFCCLGSTISGASAGVGGAFAFAVQFTPAQDGKIKEIDTGVGYVQGTKSVTIGLYNDNGGVPGTQIAGGDSTTLGGFGDCCTMASVNIKASITGGTPYWVVVSASGTTWDAWTSNSTDQVDELTAAFSSDGGETWTAGGALPGPSLQIIGK